MNHIRIIRDGGAVNTHSAEYYSSYLGEIVLIRTGQENEHVPLYQFDSVFIMNDNGDTVDKWGIPADKEE